LRRPGIIIFGETVCSSFDLEPFNKKYSRVWSAAAWRVQSGQTGDFAPVLV
jgi:hypothetical protein